MRKIFFFLVVLLCCAHPATADETLADLALEARAQALFHDTRCASCQTQTIDSSPAQVAIDMRALIRHRLTEGASDVQIRDELRAAYGDAIFLTPPVQKNTYALWILPVLILLALIWIMRHGLQFDRKTT